MTSDHAVRKLMKRGLRPLSDVSQQEVERACDRVLTRLQKEPDTAPAVSPLVAPDSGSRVRPTWTWATAAVLVLAAAVATTMLWRSSVDLFRVVDGDVRQGETIGSGDGAGALLELTDGSRVEMRPRSELAIERADDGIRIRLHSGGIIVNAAKQRNGHLYVQTKDVVISVVGTVFVVNAEERGSRVAVIEGEVRVRQGETEKRLLTGEQVATSPLVLPAPPVGEDIAWSRNADALRARWQQSPVVPTATARQISYDPPFTFEAASVRPSPPLPEGMRSGPYAGCTGGPVQLDARRFAASNKTLFHLITIAYGARGRGCSVYSANELLSGGPSWVRTDQFSVEALIPEGVPQYTSRQLADGNAPRLQAMLQQLLADRFNLVLRRETKEMPAYTLTVGGLVIKRRVGRDLTEPLSSDEVQRIGRTTGIPGFVPDPEQQGVFIESRSPGVLVMWGRRASMADLAAALTSLTGTGRQVMDRTDVPGEFTFDIDGFASAIYDYKGAPPPRSIFKALDEELGLRLEESREKVEALVIERADKPSDN